MSQVVFISIDISEMFKRIGIERRHRHNLASWVHARRKLIEAQRAAGKKDKSAKADDAVKVITKFYALEKALKDASPETRYAQRQEDSQTDHREIAAMVTRYLTYCATQNRLGQGVALSSQAMAKIHRLSA